MNNKKYITTAIDYPNGKPHLGHVFEKVLADTYHRWYLKNNYESFLLTGTDENGQKLVESARKLNLNTLDFVDKNVLNFKNLCTNLSINYSKFIRTTDQLHKDAVNEIWNILKSKNLVYKKDYSGAYCLPCESFKTKSQQKNDKCLIHDVELELKEESGFFFKLSNFQESILQYYLNNQIIQPVYRQDEIINFLKNEKLEDLCISRPNNFNWGIEIPDNEEFVFYTWFDALINYYSGNKEGFSPDLQIIGKDILWFHAIIWIGILIAVDFELPKQIYVHGFITDKNGEKLSKTKGNYIDIENLLSEYHSDIIRYYLLLNIPSFQDGKFSLEELKDIYNSHFVEGIGNLYSRILSLIEKRKIVNYGNIDESVKFKRKEIIEEIRYLFEEREHGKAILILNKKLTEINKYLTDNQPWNKKSDNYEIVLNTSLYNFKLIIELLEPVIPKISKKIIEDISEEIIKFKGHLFKRKI